MDTVEAGEGAVREVSPCVPAAPAIADESDTSSVESSGRLVIDERLEDVDDDICRGSDSSSSLDCEREVADAGRDRSPLKRVASPEVLPTTDVGNKRFADAH